MLTFSKCGLGSRIPRAALASWITAIHLDRYSLPLHRYSTPTSQLNPQLLPNPDARKMGISGTRHLHATSYCS